MKAKGLRFLDFKNIKKLELRNICQLPKIINSGKYFLSLHKTQKANYVNYYPLSAEVFITRRCNLRCPQCWLTLTRNFNFTGPDISTAQFTRFAERVKHHVWGVLLGGGEPFLHKEIFDFIARLKKQHLYSAVSTNGTLLRQTYKDIIRCRLDSLNISLDGYDAVSYHNTRNAPEKVYGEILEGIKQLVAYRNAMHSRLFIKINFTVNRKMLADLEKMIRAADALQVDYISFNNINTYGDAEFVPLSDDDPEVLACFAQITQHTNFHAMINLPILLSKTRPRFCRDPFFYVGADFTGNMTPCCFALHHEKYGNIFNENYWNSPAILALRKTFTEQQAEWDMCKNCCRKFENTEVISFQPDQKKWHNLHK